MTPSTPACRDRVRRPGSWQSVLVGNRFDAWWRGLFEDDSLPDYELPDPELTAYDRGLGTLAVAGEVKGYLASVRLVMCLPGKQWWPWFVVVWADGRKEHSFEDYGPKWYIVRELDAGRLDHHGPSVEKTLSLFGHRFRWSESGDEQTYDFAWLPAEDAERKWRELGVTDDDF